MKNKTNPPLPGDAQPPRPAATPPMEGNAQAKISPPAEGHSLAAGKGQATRPERRRGEPDGVVPKLRFPAFQGDWHTQELGSVAAIINDRAGDKKYRLMSITSGVGLVSQIEKFGREIAGNAYKNYIVIQNDDFAYNKSATKEYPEGFIAKYTGTEPGAVPNSIFLCFRVSKGKISPEYLNYLFYANLHGKWLRKFIAVGARAHGSLNVDEAALLSLPVPLPKGASSLSEQQRIADCLTSLDQVINAEAQKLDALKAHKKGLMQQLFPAEGETVPRLRFPEFRDSGEWEQKSIEELIANGVIVSHLDGNHGELYPRAEEFTSQGIPYISANDFVNGFVDFRKCKYLATSRAQQFRKGVAKDGDILFAHNVTVGPVAKLETNFEFVILSTTATYFRCDTDHLINDFLKACLASPPFIKQYTKVMKQSTRNQVPITTQRKFFLTIPTLPEQKRIANCLTSLDELIAAQAEKIAALKEQKKGLMQGLFPNHPAPAGHPSAGGEGSGGI